MWRIKTSSHTLFELEYICIWPRISLLVAIPLFGMPCFLTKLSSYKKLILKISNYRICDSYYRGVLQEKARRAATVSGKPIFIFRELLNYLIEEHIIIPAYSFMQDIVGTAITSEEQRLIKIIQNHLSETDKQHLKELLYNSSGLYEITRRVLQNS